MIEVKSKEQPEGFLCGRINNHRNKWFTNGDVDIRFTHALDESYRYGRIYPDQKCSYWNNGKITVFANKCPGEGFVIGNLNFKYSVGMLYWNNGVVNVRSKECPGEGFVKGMLKKK